VAAWRSIAAQWRRLAGLIVWAALFAPCAAPAQGTLAIGLVPVVHAISGALAQWNVRGLFLAAGALLAGFNILMLLTSKAAREID
jgi:hypothetical protein